MLIGNCRERIEGLLPQLTNTEKKVAVYALEHFEELIHFNVTELAKNTDVSDATIVRFCRSIGYKGFTDFKMNIARELTSKEDQFYPTIRQGDGIEEICSKIFRADSNVLNRTLMSLDMGVLERAADKIYHSKRVIIFGTGGSNVVAQDAQHKLLKIGLNALALSDVDLQLMASSTMTDQDVAIGISFSGNNYHVINCIRNAKNRGSYCLGVISQDKSPLSKIVDDTISCASDETFFQSESGSSRIAQLAVIDALVGVVSFKDYYRFYENVELTREATTESKY